MKRRNLILLLGGTGSAALSTGTGAFSSASADRSVEVSVVEDENAYVGYEALPEVVEQTDDDDEEKKSITVEDGHRVKLLKIENRFPGDSGIGVVGIDFADDDHLFSDLAVELSDDDEYEQMEDSEVRRGPYKKGGPVPDKHAFGPGECAYVTADVHRDSAVDDVEGPAEYHIEITIRVRGTEDTGVSASIFGDTRAFKLRIEADEDDDGDDDGDDGDDGDEDDGDDDGDDGDDDGDDGDDDGDDGDDDGDDGDDDGDDGDD